MRKIKATESNTPYLVLQAALAAPFLFRKARRKRVRTIFSLKSVACVFNGMQPYPGRKPLELWTVKGSIPIGINGDRRNKNLRGSTVTAETLFQLGFVPAPVIA